MSPASRPVSDMRADLGARCTGVLLPQVRKQRHGSPFLTLFQLFLEQRATPHIEEEKAKKTLEIVSAKPKAALDACPPRGAFMLSASLVRPGIMRPICTRPTPTIIFVSQSETCSKLVFA